MSVIGEEAGAGLRNARLAASEFVRKNRGKSNLIGDIATGLSDLGVSGEKERWSIRRPISSLAFMREIAARKKGRKLVTGVMNTMNAIDALKKGMS